MTEFAKNILKTNSKQHNITAMAVNKLNLAVTIRQTRKLADLSQNDLAECAGVGKTLIFNLEKGHQNVSLENLIKIFDVLNIEFEIKPPQLEKIPQKSKARK